MLGLELLEVKGYDAVEIWKNIFGISLYLSFSLFLLVLVESYLQIVLFFIFGAIWIFHLCLLLRSTPFLLLFRWLIHEHINFRHLLLIYIPLTIKLRYQVCTDQRIIKIETFLTSLIKFWFRLLDGPDVMGFLVKRYQRLETFLLKRGFCIVSVLLHWK